MSKCEDMSIRLPQTGGETDRQTELVEQYRALHAGMNDLPIKPMTLWIEVL